MPIGVPGARWKLWAGVLALLATWCVAVAAIYVIDATYFHWKAGSSWRPVVSPHGWSIFVFLTTWLASVILMIAVGVWWVINRKKRIVPQRLLRASFISLLIAAASFMVSQFLYVAFAVLVLGPGPHSTYFQQSAAIYDSITLLNTLILRGAQLDDTLLSFAAYNDSPRVVRRLIERGARVNERHYDTKITALHKAVEGRRYENAAMLVEAEADPSIADARGVTPLDLAMTLKDDRMIEVLKGGAAGSRKIQR